MTVWEMKYFGEVSHGYIKVRLLEFVWNKSCEKAMKLLEKLITDLSNRDEHFKISQLHAYFAS